MKRYQKGYILVIVLVFAMIMGMLSIGLYSLIYHMTKGTRIGEVEKIKGYYYCIAALRYANILLRDCVGPDTIIRFNNPEFDGEERTLNVMALYDCQGFKNDLGLAAPKGLVIYLRESGSQGNPDANGNYAVTATYTY